MRPAKQQIRNLTRLIICSHLFFCFTPSSFAQGAYAPRELLLFQEIPVVSIAAKHPQRITDTPSTTYLITEEEIRISGATNIPELLRMVPGFNVMATTASDFNVSSRGGNQLLANKLLILIDGRYVYQDMYGMVFWESLTVLLEDIKQIEIVKGPASALYGANAFSGVINIVTKDPGSEPGTTLSFSDGDPSNNRKNFVHRGRRGKISYKVSAADHQVEKWEETDAAPKGFTNRPGNSEEMTKYWGMLQYHPKETSSVALSGGRSYGDMEFYPIEYLTVLPIEKELEWYRLKYSDNHLMIHYFQNSGMMEFYQSFSDTAEYRSKEGEFTWNGEIGEHHHLTMGGSKRKNDVLFAGGTIYEYGRKQNLWGLYVEDEFRMTDRVTFHLGGRYDDHSLSDSQFSPRGSVVYHTSEKEAVKLSVSKAYRNPTHFENYLQFIETLATGADFGLGGIINDFDFSLLGNSQLKPEEVVSYNLGYQSNRERQSITADFFYNDIKNVIQHRYRTGNVLDVEKDINFKKDYVNAYSAHSYGVEFLIDRKFTAALSGKLSYALLREERDDTNERIETSPSNKVAAEITHKTDKGITFNLQGIYVGSTKWKAESFDIDESGLPATVLLDSIPVTFNLPSYRLVNARIGIKMGSNMEASIAGFNIFNHHHREFPKIDMPIYDPGTFDEFAPALTNSKSNTISRRVTASVRLDF